MPFRGKNLWLFLLGLAALPLAAGTAVACPDLTTCRSDEQMSIERDERGCNIVTCLKAEANQVDEYYQDIPQVPKARTVENGNAAVPVAKIEPILSGPKTEEEESKEQVATENPALAAPVADAPAEHAAAEPESQKQPVVESGTPANEEAVATKNPETAAEPEADHPAQAAEPAAAPEKAPRADVPASPAAKVTPPASAI